MLRSITVLIGYRYICGGELNRPLNYALIKQSLIWTDKEPGNLATIWKTGLSVRKRWERGMAELWVNLERGKKAGGDRARKRRTHGQETWGKQWEVEVEKDSERRWVLRLQTNMNNTEVYFNTNKMGGGQVSLMQIKVQLQRPIWQLCWERPCGTFIYPLYQ